MPTLQAVLKDEKTIWQRIRVNWYNQHRRELEISSGTAVWYRIGQQPLLGLCGVGKLGPKGGFAATLWLDA